VALGFAFIILLVKNDMVEMTSAVCCWGLRVGKEAHGLVGIIVGCRLDGWGSVPGRGKRFFSTLQHYD
jgi:hypothetical protein